MNKPEKQNLEELELLFEFASPGRLRKQITFLLAQYIINTPHGLLLKRTPKIAEDMLFLMEFFDKTGKNWRKSKKA